MLFLTVAAQGPGVQTAAIFASILASTPSAADRAGVGVPTPLLLAAGDSISPPSGVPTQPPPSLLRAR
jgi:hypothetical protein